MTLQKVSGGWINTDFENMEEERPSMITQERKSKYKHKIIIPAPTTWTSPKDDRNAEIREWCTELFGPGGRKNRWRFGWTHTDSTYYFRSGKDAMMFTLRWAS